MKTILTLDKANQPYGFPQLDGSGSLQATGSLYGTSSWAVSASWAPVTAGGSNTQIQFNSGSALTGTGSFTFNYQSQSLQQGFAVTASGIYSHAEGAANYTDNSTPPYNVLTENGTLISNDYTLFINGIPELGSTITSLQYYGDLTGYTFPITVEFIQSDYFEVNNKIYAKPVITNITYDSGTDISTLTITGLENIYYNILGTTSSLATGVASHVEGLGNTAFGIGSHAEGSLTIASGSYSHAEGQGTLAVGANSHAEGINTEAVGGGSHTEGGGTTTVIKGGYTGNRNGNILTVDSKYGNITTSYITGSTYLIGNNVNGFLIVSGSYNGLNTLINLDNPFGGQGPVTFVFGVGSGITWGGDTPIESPGLSHAEGQSTIASGYASHAEGFENLASGPYSHAEGYYNKTIGNYSHAEGGNTRAVGGVSHAEGAETTAVGGGSHTEGYQTITKGYASHAEGWGTVTSGSYQHAQGQYNLSSSAQSAFIIGNGINDNNRSNLVFASGSTFQITGSLRVSGSITGSLLGTSSFTISSSFATTASYALNAGTTIDTGSFVTTSSFNAFTSSYNTGSFTGSFTGSLFGTASFASTASFAPNYLPLTGGTINGDVTVNGTASIAFLNVTIESASVIYSSGSNQFGDATSDIQTLIGTVLVSGSQQITGSLNVTQGITGSLFGTASWADNATTSSFVTGSNVFGPFGSNSITSASFAVSSSRAVTSSFAISASWAPLNAGGSNTQIQFNSGSRLLGTGSFTFDYLNQSLQQGLNVTASGLYSHAEGQLTRATGNYSHTEGYGNLASGPYSHAQGNGTTASGSYSHTEGFATLASNFYSHAKGNTTRATGQYAQSDGNSTLASGEYSHTRGNQTTASGNYSHAEGNSTQAIGNYSHAEGNTTQAIGVGSHAEGDRTTASGPASHAEGYLTLASNYSSHAEGQSTTASGQFSHAEGWFTQASGVFSHAEGYLTLASGERSHAEGQSTQTLGQASHAEGISSITGTNTAFSKKTDAIINGQITLSGDETSKFTPGGYLYVYNVPDDTKTTYLIDTVNYDGSDTLIQLVDTSVNINNASFGDVTYLKNNGNFGGDKPIPGNYSHAEGGSTQAIGDFSHAEGKNTNALGNYSHAEGLETLTQGIFSHAEGSSTQAIGEASHAEGRFTTASGDYSHAEGDTTQTGITTAFKTAEEASIDSGLIRIDGTYGDVTAYFTPGNYLYLYDGEFNNNYGYASFLIDTVFWNDPETFIQLVDTSVNTNAAYVGDLTYLKNNGTFGGNKTIPGNYSHAEGNNTITLGSYSHAEGNQTQASGRYSHAEGNNTQAIGEYSHAEGNQTQAIGISSHAEGNITQAIGISSHAEGNITKAIGEYSHAEGDNTQARGNYSHAEGQETVSSGNYSHAEGWGTVSLGQYQHVQGQYNISSEVQSAFIHGNGTDDGNRSNLIYAHDSIVEITGSLNVSQGITGSLFGTSSWAQNAQTASFVTASNVFGPFGSSSIASASFAVSSSRAVSSSFALTSSFATTASYISPTFISASAAASGFGSGGGGGDTSGLLTTASFNSYTSSNTSQFAGTASFAFTSSFTQGGNGSFSGSFTGSLFGTASWADNSLTASFVTASNVFGPFGSNSITSASYALTASYSKNLQISGSINNVDYIDFSTGSVVIQPTPGRLSWNDTDGTLDIGLKGGNVTLQIGQEEVARVVNKTGGNLLEADYRAVRVRSVAEGGAQGQRLAVVLAQADNDANSATTLGIVTEDIDVNQDGFITLSGQVRGINTTGTLQGETWTDGDVLYLSPTTPGYLTKTKPQAPQHTVIVGYVEYAHNNQGKIFVKVDNGYEIDELHNVRIDTGSLTSGQLLVRSGSVWTNSNQLTGSYGLTGSLQATSFTGSLFGTSSFATTASYASNGGVTSIVAGTNITISSATGNVTINSTGGGGGGGTDLGLVQAMTVGLQNIF
jgi:hypothetical protein